MEMGQPSAAEAIGVLDAVTIANRYAIVPVLEGVDCGLRPGRICTVIGENGAGRSTLFKIVSGLIPPTSGVLPFDGEPLNWPCRTPLANGASTLCPRSLR